MPIARTVTLSAFAAALTLLALFAAAVDPGPDPARAGATVTLTVNSSDDSDDGTCDDTHCSLREAINAANNFFGADSTIAFDLPFLDRTIQPTSLLPPLTANDAVIDGYSQEDASENTNDIDEPFNAEIQIVLDGSNAGRLSDGLVIEGSGTTVRGLEIINWGRRGLILDGSDNIASGNAIGANGSGDITTVREGGIDVAGTNNTVGGTSQADRNLIAGNDGSGVVIFSGQGHTVQGNIIGLDFFGTGAFSNTDNGVLVHDFAQDAVIGGDTPAARNVIAASGSENIFITSNQSNTVQGNYIGTDVTGTAALGGTVGIAIFDSQNNVIGGPGEGEGNLISGNELEGITITQSAPPAGADAAGGTAGAPTATGNVVQGNTIGLDRTGTVPLGNGAAGVLVTNAADNTIGGTVPDAGNTIAFNGGDGVELDVDNAGAPTGTRILGNDIFSNDALGIDLQDDGVTPNDPGDADDGSNRLQNFPELTAAIAGSLTIEGSLNTTPNTEVRIEFFLNGECDPSGHGEGEVFLGSIAPNPTTDGSGNLEFSATAEQLTVSEGTQITATATNVGTGDTSEFSACIEVEGAPTATPTATHTSTPTDTQPAPTATNTPTPTDTQPAPTATDTPTRTPTDTPTRTPTVSAGPPGDVSCDGVTDSVDALLILQVGALLLDELPCPANADVSGDGSISSVDAAIILQCTSGLLDCASLGGHPR